MQYRSMRLRALVLAFALGAGAAAASCGGDSKKNETPPPAESAGAPNVVGPIECGGETCEPVKLVKGLDPLAPCCAEGDVCGLDSSFIAQYGTMFSVACQPKNQPGEDGHGCPNSPMLTVPGGTFTIPELAGCCRTETKTCGYRLDKLLGLFDVSLGCIDSTPFLEGGTAEPCDPESP
jgi:hypothetical protein